MIPPGKDTQRAFEHVSQNVPRVEAFLKGWYERELSALPRIPHLNQALASGRCQVLKEICDLLDRRGT